MNCYNHSDTAAVSFCRACGRGLCPLCQRVSDGTIWCPEHAPAAQNSYSGYSAGGGTEGAYSGANPYAQPQGAYTPPPPAAPGSFQASPILAFILGFIPGVGAIYNGQYLKGLVHAGIFGLLVSLLNSSDGRGAEPFFGILLTALIFYMPFEAYHTAKRRQAGLPVEEWSSFGRGPMPMGGGRAPIGPIILIGLGVLFLLDTMNLIEFREIGRFWPVLLIAVGASMLYSRVSPSRGPATPPSAGGYYGGPGAPPPPPPGPGASGMGYPPPAATPGSELVETGHE